MSNDRIAAFLNAVSDDGLDLSEASVYHFCKDFSKKTENSIANLEEELLNQPVVATDATVITVNGEQEYIRNFSTAKSVLYRAMKDKKPDTMRRVHFFEKYTGILVHDHETALYHFGTDHGECNVHVIRYLRKNTEDTRNTWSGQMIKLLCEMNQVRKAAIEKTRTGLKQQSFRVMRKSLIWPALFPALPTASGYVLDICIIFRPPPAIHPAMHLLYLEHVRLHRVKLAVHQVIHFYERGMAFHDHAELALARISLAFVHRISAEFHQHFNLCVGHPRNFLDIILMVRLLF